MPLIRRDSAGVAADPKPASDDQLVVELSHPDAETRWAAARQLGDRPGSVEHLAAAVKTEREPRVLEAILTSLIRVGGKQSTSALLPCLRSDDAALRGGAIEALQMLPDAVYPHMPQLLSDPDPDVRILAVELVRTMKPTRATALLCDMIDREAHPNACGAAVDVLAEVGTRRAMPSLERCRARFADNPFLPFAIDVAVENIRKQTN